jgi:peptide/nickel transport system ATP-binding protein
MTMTVLGVDDLGVTISTDQGPVLAVAGMSFRAEQGEMLALVGESGCGKSMTALAIMGLLPGGATTRGSITLKGRELTALSPRQMRDVRGREITMIFQEPMTSLNPAFTVGYQVAEMLRRHEGADRREALRRATELLERVGIPAPAARVREYPHQMSGGMRQRVMIAMAIACQPTVLIADEPTTALDVTIQAQILDVLRDLRDEMGMTVVLITHDLGLVADIADRVEVMYAGHRVEATGTDALFARPQHPYTVGLLDAVPRPQLRVAGERMVLRGIPGMVPTLREAPSCCVFSPRCPLADSRCRSEAPGWKEVAAGHHAACFHAGHLKPTVLADGGRR